MGDEGIQICERGESNMKDVSDIKLKTKQAHHSKKKCA